MSQAVDRRLLPDRRSLSWLAVALLFWLLNVALHLEFSNWIVRSYLTPFGELTPRDHSVTLAWVVSGGFLAWLLRQAAAGVNRRLTLGAWLLWLALAVTSMNLIASTDVEMIHFLQYGLLAYLLARAIDPGRRRWPLLTLLLLSHWLGVVDELNQYFYLTPSNNSYVDFNDFLLNLIGALAGVLAYYGFAAAPAPSTTTGATAGWRRLTLAVHGLSGMVVVLLVAGGRLIYTPATGIAPGGIASLDGATRIFLQREAGLLSSWQPSFRGDLYYVSGVWEWLLLGGLLLALASLYRRLSRKGGSDTLPRP